MLRSLFGFDWKKSPAHLLFLSKFLTPRGVEDFSESNSWESVLKEAPKKVIRRFFDEGMVEQASLAELLDHKYKATDLKAMLEKLGQKASGRKADLKDLFRLILMV